DGAIAEVADQQIDVPLAAVLRIDGEAPGRIQRSAGDEALHVIPVCVENVDDAAGGAVIDIGDGRVVRLFGVSHDDPVARGEDVERSVDAGGREGPLVDEFAGRIDAMIVGVEDVDFGVAKVGGVKLPLAVRGRNGDALVHCVVIALYF